MNQLDRLDKMIIDCIECATYRKASLQKVAPLEIWPEDARYLAGLLQELRTFRSKVDTNEPTD